MSEQQGPGWEVDYGLGAMKLLPKITATAEVQCNYPCVPECPRDHEWSK